MSRQIFAVCLKCLFSLVLLLVIGLPALAQSSSSAAVAGIVQDTTDARIPNASVKLINTDTGTESDSTTGKEGTFAIPSVLPGHYRLQIEREGFDTTQLTGITLNVGDNKAVIIRMKVGSSAQTVTVDASGLNINTTDASVSTIVDRKFVESMPLNGRSFQSLILLAPGVVTNNPQSAAKTGSAGEFSINGQRTDANYYTIDGVSANNVANASVASAPSSSGGLPAASALGSTQALVSVDALQEFRISTSTYSAEYGRQPGGQIQFETRSGTNAFHGTAFDYLRNSIFDANNWFNDYASPPLPKPAERQNDFGGVLGGPLDIPKFYSGKDRTFFFLSYEGLRLSQPEPATISYVPTNNPASTNPYGNLRNTAPAALRPLLNAFPLPNCTAQQDPQCIDDSAEGLSPYIVSTTLPSSIDAISARGDYAIPHGPRLFFRYGDTKSSAVSSITTYNTQVEYRTQSYTLGADAAFLGTLSNQFRFNYSPTYGISTAQLTTLGGGLPVNMQGLQGLASGSGETGIFLYFKKENTSLYQWHFGTPQHQWNVVDTVGWARGSHVFRVGIDYRRTTPYLNAGSFTGFPYVLYEYLSVASAQSNSADVALSQNAARQDPAFNNFSAFIQDEWRIKRRLSFSLGLRWELNPPPKIVSGVQNYTLNGNFNDPASLTLAPLGTPLYNTTYYNFAPRLGVAAILHDEPGHETVLRAGGGVYYDSGQQFTNLFGAVYGPGKGVSKYYGTNYGTSASFPLPPNLINAPISASLIPPYGNFYITSRHLQLPYTYQWNATIEQALGSDQSITVGYLGSNGRRLIQAQEYSLAKINPNFTTVFQFQNGSSSSYNALQAQYKRRLGHGLQALASYTWAHGLDFKSADSGLLPYQRGNSDFDVRNNFTAALSYDLPRNYPDAWKRALLAQWGSDLRFTARTAFPIEIAGPVLTDPATGNEYYGLLNYNNSVPLYLNQPGMPGGRVVNRAAFSAPLAGEQGNSPRNFVRGFGETEVNLAVRREFPVYEQFRLLFRVEAFNMLNHPNFGTINATCGSPTAGNICITPTFGQAAATLASSLGGLTPIYQQGGPRSLQLALKIVF